MGLVFGSVTHFWYKILDKHLAGATLQIVVKKILADQAVAAPFFCSAFFMGMLIAHINLCNNCVKIISLVLFATKPIPLTKLLHALKTLQCKCIFAYILIYVVRLIYASTYLNWT